MYMRNIIRKIKNKKLIPLIISSIFLILYFVVLPYSFLTICSGSMSKTINVDDVIFYKKIDSSYSLQEGDIIVFKNRLKKENIKLVHRIVKVQNYKDEIAGYYTKGDASDNIDHFFVYPDDVVGVYIGKINRIGYPVVLINKLLSNFNGTKELYD